MRTGGLHLLLPPLKEVLDMYLQAFQAECFLYSPSLKKTKTTSKEQKPHSATRPWYFLDVVQVTVYIAGPKQGLGVQGKSELKPKPLTD